MAFLISRECCKKRCFARCNSASLSTFAFTTKIYVIQFNQAFKDTAIISTFHDMLEFMLHPHCSIDRNTKPTSKTES